MAKKQTVHKRSAEKESGGIGGIGIDIIEVGRFRALSYRENRKFYEKIFTGREIGYCLKRAEPAQHFATRFAAKEAVIKALNWDISMMLAIEISNQKSGAPKVSVKNIQGEMLISLSHIKNTAVAIALWVR